MYNKNYLNEIDNSYFLMNLLNTPKLNENQPIFNILITMMFYCFNLI